MPDGAALVVAGVDGMHRISLAKGEPRTVDSARHAGGGKWSAVMEALRAIWETESWSCTRADMTPASIGMWEILGEIRAWLAASA